MAGTTLSSRATTGTSEGRALGAIWIAIVCWSATALFVRAGDVDPLVFTTWRLWLALPFLAAVLVWRTRRGEQIMLRAPGVSWGRWLLIVFGAGAFFASAAATAFAAIDKTRLLDVTLIGALQPVLIIVIAVMFLGEHTDRRHVTRALIAISGTVLVAGASSGNGDWTMAGELLAVLSLFLNAGWYLYGRVLRDRYAVDPFAFMLGVLTSAAILTTPVALLSAGSLRLSASALGWVAATMTFGTAAHLLLVWAHRYVPASISAPLLLAEPPLVAIGAWIFFGESLGPVEIVGSAIVVMALWGMVRSPAVAKVEADAPDLVPPT
ncbi:MAG: DMT family transporter [Acidimicrobiia bacterium]